MLINEINPFIRYARYMDIDKDSRFHEVIPLDARLFFVLSGKGVIKADNREYEMKDNSMLIVNSGVSYEFMTPEGKAKYIVLNFDYVHSPHSPVNPVPPSTPENYKPKNLISPTQFEDSFELNRTLYIDDAGFAAKRLDTIVTEYSRKLLFFGLKCSSLLCECICNALRQVRSVTTYEEKKGVFDIITYIHENYDKNLTNIMIGEEFSYHPNYISSVVKASTGMPLHKYLIHIRLLRAVEMLENSSHSVGEIASLCGFCDIGYFSAYFKKQFGTSPNHYRKNMLK